MSSPSRGPPSGSYAAPPPPAGAPDEDGNPILAGYRRWATRTPLITRLSVLSVIICYILSFFFPLELALTNVPYLTVLHFQLFRLLAPSLVGDSIFNLIILLLFYPGMASGMEMAIGSLHFAYLLFFLSLLTNIIFDLVCFLLYFMGDGGALLYTCNGFWVVAFSLITIDCMRNPEMPRQLMFIPVNIPSKYMPLVLYGFFCLFSGLQLDFFLSMAVGYLHSQGYFEKVMPTSERLQSLEGPSGHVLGGNSGGYLSSFVQHVAQFSGFVSASQAVGFTMYSGVDTFDSQSSHGQEQQRQSMSSGGQPEQGGGMSFYSVNARPRPTSGSSSANPMHGTQPRFASGPSSSSSSSSSGSSYSAPKPSREDLKALRLAAIGGSSQTQAQSQSQSQVPSQQTSQQQRQYVPTAQPVQTRAVAGNGFSTQNYSLPEPSAPVYTNEGDLSILLEMGFPRSQAQAALENSGGNIELALQILTSQP